MRYDLLRSLPGSIFYDFKPRISFAALLRTLCAYRRSSRQARRAKAQTEWALCGENEVEGTSSLELAALTYQGCSKRGG